MKIRSLILAIIFQILLIIAMLAYALMPLYLGKEVKVRVNLYDPRDLFRGNYVSLSYDFSDFSNLQQSKFDEKELSELLDDIFGECEYQETFWHATPFALVFLVRIYKSALGEKGETAKFISRKLELFFKFMLEICEKLEQLEHAKPLTKMEQMLEPKYLDIVDQDELSYDDRLFYSFYYYSRMVLQSAFVKI